MAKTDEIWWLLSPMSPLWGCAGLSLAQSTHPGCHSTSVPSRRGGVGHQQTGWHWVRGRGAPTAPLGAPSPAVTTEGERCPGAVPTQGAHPWRSLLSPTWRCNIPPWAPRGPPGCPSCGPSQALGSNVHEERGGGQGRPVPGEQVDVAVPWGHTGAQRVAGAVPVPGGQRGGARTHLGACWAGAA